MEPTELRTERLLLRPFQETDVGDVLAYSNDEEWSRYTLGVPRPYTREHAERLVAEGIEANWDIHPTFAVVLEGRVIGRISAYIDEQTQIAELGFDIAREYWGRGLAREAISALIDYAFTTYSSVRLIARADVGNERSWRLMERLGMQREGYLRSQRVGRDGRSDEVFYGLLREEWEADQS